MLRLLMAKIKHLDIEVSSTCQAACPMCARHTAGKTTIDPVNQTLADVKRTYREISKGLETITMCGNIGDTMGNKDIALICRWFIMRNPNIEITIHTNGGLGSPKTYKELALLGVRIVVAIDGMEDTNHYHRVGVKWKNLLKNLEAYQSGFENKIKVRWTEKRNNNGNVGEYGMIEIQMLIWKHNQHQVLEMADFAQQHKANLWYRRANTATSEQFNNGTPVFTVTGRWTCNIYSPDPLMEELASYRFNCPHQWFDGNNMRDHVSDTLDNIFKDRGDWHSIIDNPIPVDTDPNHAPEHRDNFQQAVQILFDKPNTTYYRKALLTDEIARDYSGSVACKSFNWLDPQNTADKDGEREVFISADGFVSPCCMIGSSLSRHIANSMYPGKPRAMYEWVSQDVVNRILAIGIDKFDISKHTLEEILDSGVLDELVYDTIDESDVRKGRIPFCTSHCGSHNSFGRPSDDDRDDNKQKVMNYGARKKTGK